MTALNQTGYGAVYGSVFVESGFKKVVIEVDGKSFEIQILFPSQVGDPKLAHGLQVFRVTDASDLLISSLNLVTAAIGPGHVGNVVATIAILGPARVFWAQTLAASLH